MWSFDNGTIEWSTFIDRQIVDVRGVPKVRIRNVVRVDVALYYESLVPRYISWYTYSKKYENIAPSAIRTRAFKFYNDYYVSR